MKQQKYILPESEIPRQWYNLAPDLPTPLLPPLGPDGNPIGPEMLAPIFPMGLIEQEVSQERWIDIPEEILDILCRWRPTPLRRAIHLEKHLDTPAHIYYKDESVSPAGSHKPNTAVVDRSLSFLKELCRQHSAFGNRFGRDQDITQYNNLKI